MLMLSFEKLCFFFFFWGSSFKYLDFMKKINSKANVYQFSWGLSKTAFSDCQWWSPKDFSSFPTANYVFTRASVPVSSSRYLSFCTCAWWHPPLLILFRVILHHSNKLGCLRYESLWNWGDGCLYMCSVMGGFQGCPTGDGYCIP